MGRVCNIATAHLGGNAVNVSKRACFTAAALMAVASAAFAHEPYLDDRSTATSVVRSYYNAINSREYSRAWSYRMLVVSDTDWRAEYAAYEKFRDGFGGARGHISVQTGPEIEDVAVGTLRYGVPVAINVVSEDGRHQQFAGCFYLRLSSPAAQDGVPYQPMYIERTAMRSAKGRLKEILPAECDPA